MYVRVKPRCNAAAATPEMMCHHRIAFCCAFYPRATLQARTNEALADRSASWCEAVRVRRCVANVLGTALCARRHVCPVPTEEEVVWRRRRGRNRECAPRCSAAASRQATRTQSVVPAAATRCAPSRTASRSHTCLEKCACGNTQMVDDTSVSGVQRGAEKIQEVMVRTTSALLTFILGFSTRRNKRTRSAVRREWRMEL